MKPYPTYQPSGLDWLPQVPAHWEVLPNFAQFSERIERGFNDAELLAVTMKQGVIRQSDVENKRDQSNEDKSAYKRVCVGDLAYNKMRMWQGAAGYSDFEGIVSPAYIVLKPRTNAISKYFHHLFRMPAYMNQSYRSSYGICDDQLSLRFDDFKRIYSLVPPPEEQAAIVAFIGHKAKSINDFVAAKRRIIALLREQKTALINRAVTQGINPSAPRRASGVDWLGDVPAHWEVKPLFALARERQEKNSGMQVQDVLSLSYGRIVLRNMESNSGLIPMSFETYQIVNPGNIILRLTDLQNDQKSLRVGLARQRGIITSAYLCLESKKNADSGFVYLMLHAYDLAKIFYRQGGGVRQSMAFDDLKRLPLVVPPTEEQAAIVEHIECETQLIETTIATAEREIELMQELKTSLIASAVTGQIDVRDYQVPHIEYSNDDNAAPDASPDVLDERMETV